MRCLAGLPFSTLVQGHDSSDIPLLRFNPPLRSVLEISVLQPLDSGQLSWVSCSLQRTQATRVHVHSALPAWLPDPALRPNQYVLAGPNPPATVPLPGFLNLSATSSSHNPPAIFRQVAFLGFALQGFTPSTKPLATRRRQITLLSFLPPAAQPKVLGLGFLRAHDPLPRMVRNHTIYRLQGLRPRASQSSFQAQLDWPFTLTCPSWAFTSSWCLP
jgi:hypothetical protein